MNRLMFSVRGARPVPWGSGEWAWRAAVAESARAVRPAVGSQKPPRDARFAVDLHFFLMPGTLERVDLDNLAKPVLDTLFLPRYPQVKDPSLTGAAFEVDDDRVDSLSLRKSAVPTSDREGIDVIVTW